LTKIVNITLTLIFIVFAAIQFNDPDPLFWIIIYGFVAVISALATFGKYYNLPTIIGMVVSFVWAGILFPSIIELVTEHELKDLTANMHADREYIEKARESFGLLIAFFALLYHFYRGKKVKRQY